MHRYLTAGSRQKGPLAVFHAYGDETALARTLDTKVCAQTNPAPVNAMAIHDLRYGWLRDQTGEIVDEVMLACPSPRQRVLMTHGGAVIREQVESYFKEAGFSPLTEAEFPEVNDPLLDPVLAACVTEGQAAAVLAARARGEIPDAAHILAQHRVVLAGPPNAGKSSLLNALAGYDRAFVDPEAGATRDVVDELIDLNGHAVWIGDLPGYTDHIGMDEIWQKAALRLRLAEMIWFVVDSSEEWSAEAESAASVVAEISRPVLVILNKSDLPRRLAGVPWKKHFPNARSLAVSTLPEGNAVPALEEYAAAAFA